MADLIATLTQWSSVKPLIESLPQWIKGPDQERFAAYQIYEQIYRNVEGTFKLQQRGESNNKPIYIPTGKVIVNTLHRYMANDLSLLPDPKFGTDTERATALQAFTDFLRRETFYSKFSTNKREGIYRGDWLWHLYADPSRPQGSRISIFPLDPGYCFKITADGNVDDVIGYHIVEKVTETDGKVYMRRLTYRKATGKGGPSRILVTDETYDVDKWGGPDMEQGPVLKTLRPGFTLPAQIDALPIYHIPNEMVGGAPWGMSELAGLERIMAAVNQSISDEELALALDGIGFWASNVEAIDPQTKQPVPWRMAPGSVAVAKSAPNPDFIKRVSGVTSVTPYKDHREYLHEQLDEAAGTPPVAKGRTNVGVAESGIKLRLELGPIIARGAERELVVTDRLVQLWYDFRKWWSAYEGPELEPVRFVPAYGPKIPDDPKEVFERIMKLVERRVVSLAYARTLLTKKLGFEFPPDPQLWKEILEELEGISQAEADAGASRLAREGEMISAEGVGE